MFEELINKKIKCVWNDGDDSKAVYGVVESADDSFLKIRTDKDNSLIHISIQSIITVKEVE